MLEVVEGVLSADVADNGTRTISYPNSSITGYATDAGTFKSGFRHQLMVGQNGPYYSPNDFALTFGTSTITITNRTEGTLRAGTPFRVSLERPGSATVKSDRLVVRRSAPCSVIQVNIGAPITADADGICAAQDPSGAGNLTLNGVRANSAGTLATLDVPRNITITSAADDSALTFTVYGKDEYGVSMTETITGANATVAAGLKAFKTVSRVAVSGNSGSVQVGFGDVLGIPFFLSDGDLVVKEMEDDTLRTNGTFVAGVQSEASATTGDVRGTYDPNSACNGSLTFRLFILTADPGYLGAPQYSA